MIRVAMDSAIAQSGSMAEFYACMEKMGYSFRFGYSDKLGKNYFAVKAPGADRGRRDYKLGHGYSIEDIAKRIGADRTPLQEYPAIRKLSYIRMGQLSRFQACMVRRVRQATDWHLYELRMKEQSRVHRDLLMIDDLREEFEYMLEMQIKNPEELNTDAQMIFTVHDINLMDCKRLFRKEQIWFVDKDENGVYVYSLADFTAESGVKDTSDIIEKYRKGAFAALPDPELINSLLSIKGNAKEAGIDD